MGVKVWVLWHQYPDKSGAHIERVYFVKARGEEDLALLTEGDACKSGLGWKLEEVDVFGPGRIVSP